MNERSIHALTYLIATLQHWNVYNVERRLSNLNKFSIDNCQKSSLAFLRHDDEAIFTRAVADNIWKKLIYWS